MRMFNPPHPGSFVKTEIVEAHDLTVTDAADVLGVSRPALSAFLNGRASLSGTMALRVEKAFGVRMDTLMRMQSSYDIARARRREAEVEVAGPGDIVPTGRARRSQGRERRVWGGGS